MTHDRRSKAKMAKKLPGPRRKLLPQQQRWLDHYLVHRNGTQASIAAGYSVKSASSFGSVLLKNPLVQKALAEYDFEKSYPKTVDKGWIIQQLHKSYETYQKGSSASAVRCLEQLIKLSDFNPDNNQDKPVNPGKSLPGQTSETSFDQMPTGEQIDVLRRTIERLAHGNGTAESKAGEK